MFKYLSICFLLWCGFISHSVVFGQNKLKKHADEIRTEMWDSSLPEFKVIQVPDKWKNESAVILAQTFKNVYFKESLIPYVSENTYVHKRIKLLDKASVEAFSEFKIPNDQAVVHYYAGFKVVKSNGQEQEIDLANLVKMEQKLNNQKESYNKLAIPDLAPGDIIDFYLCEERSIPLKNPYYEFSTAIYTLAEKYPIVKQRFYFDVLRRCYINFKSVNGAPDLDAADKSENETKHFTLTDQDRDKVESDQWFYPYRSLPTIKFKVVYTVVGSPFLGTAGTVKRTVEKSEIEKYMFSMGVQFAPYEALEIRSYLRKNYKDERDPEKVVRLIYYYYRNKQMVAQAEKKFLTQEDSYSGRYFPLIVSNVLQGMNIPHDLCLATPRYVSTLQDIIMSNETTFFLRLNEEKNPFYVFENSMHSDFKEIDSDYQGVQAYFLNSTELFSKVRELKTLVVPITNEDANRTEKQIEILVDKADFSTVKIKENTLITGAAKSYYQNQLLSPYDFIAEEQTILPVEPLVNSVRKSEKANVAAKLESRKEEHRKELSDWLKKQYEDEFSVKIADMDDISITNTGRMPDKPELTYALSAKMEGLTKKVGSDYLIEVGKLIGGQITLTNEQKTKRLYDVYMPYARSFQHTITMQIPEGYSIQGLDKFNLNVMNSTGGFESQASISGNVLTIRVIKYYTHNFESAANWTQMVSFLEAAYTFTQQKLLLKKTSASSN